MNISVLQGKAQEEAFGRGPFYVPRNRVEFHFGPIYPSKLIRLKIEETNWGSNSKDDVFCLTILNWKNWSTRLDSELVFCCYTEVLPLSWDTISHCPLLVAATVVLVHTSIGKMFSSSTCLCLRMLRWWWKKRHTRKATKKWLLLPVARALLLAAAKMCVFLLIAHANIHAIICDALTGSSIFSINIILFLHIIFEIINVLLSERRSKYISLFFLILQRNYPVS